MCGIAGYIDLRNEFRIEQDVLIRMANTLRHRGPDSSGFFVDRHVGFGFCRLSIIDLETGDQPLYNEDHSIVLICNGEIYNYRELRAELEQKHHIFYTHSDVEVLLHLYEEAGVDCLKRLNGQFAFALYDQRKQLLFLARDHFGINPLFYTVKEGLFIFASEIKAILAHPFISREVDLTGLDQVFSFPGLVSPRTMFKGIYSLESGHSIVVEDSAVKNREYWDLDYPKMNELPYHEPESCYVERLKELLIQSVQYRLQSDVPVGFYLSGGLDSSIIARIICNLIPTAQFHGFSIDFVNQEASERKYQQLMVNHLDSLHHQTLFDYQAVTERLSAVVYHAECPVKETYNTCSLALSKAAADNHIKVVLCGEGADEFFAGYVGYRFDAFHLRKKKRYDLAAILEDELREKLWGNKNIFYEKDYFAFQETKRTLYSAKAGELFPDFDCLDSALVNKEKLQDRHPLHQRSYLDFKLRMIDHLLSDHGDRMAMAHSVEARYPFLDINLVEFVKTIPPSLKLNHYTEKYILKQVAKDFIPLEIVQREKFGWHAPGSPELLQRNVEWVQDLLSYERIKQQGYFNPDVIEGLKSKYSKVGFKLAFPFESDLLMIVLTFGLFLDLYKMPHLT